MVVPLNFKALTFVKPFVLFKHFWEAFYYRSRQAPERGGNFLLDKKAQLRLERIQSNRSI